MAQEREEELMQMRRTLHLPTTEPPHIAPKPKKVRLRRSIVGWTTSINGRGVRFSRSGRRWYGYFMRGLEPVATEKTLALCYARLADVVDAGRRRPDRFPVCWSLHDQMFYIFDMGRRIFEAPDYESARAKQLELRGAS